jgi:hypothetical protein
LLGGTIQIELRQAQVRIEGNADPALLPCCGTVLLGSG